MTEIRLCRKPEVVVTTEGGWPEAFVWLPDTPARRRELETMVKAGNLLYGVGTHWVEDREAGREPTHSSD